ncbi:hypothetical protein SMD11_3195 [Streptomyces albireticuli]|uniref:Uncharacterized protein n=1 Tax=Streptomyces albireticuli TaxID=1940 RepID=A0A1Z2L3G8_9ACTN|nr:hypothetical protein SMD11_3195 [Streptomyces albireticuli]
MTVVEIVLTVLAILALIALGALLIHLLNAQHEQRIASFHYSGVLPWRGGWNPKRRLPARQPAKTYAVSTRREHPRTSRGRR